MFSSLAIRRKKNSLAVVWNKQITHICSPFFENNHIEIGDRKQIQVSKQTATQDVEITVKMMAC